MGNPKLAWKNQIDSWVVFAKPEHKSCYLAGWAQSAEISNETAGLDMLGEADEKLLMSPIISKAMGAQELSIRQWNKTFSHLCSDAWA